MKRENESQRGVSRREMLMRGGSAVAAAGIGPSIAAASQNPSPSGRNGKSPNILFIMGDDVGIWNISAYHRGMMGGSTPNIDRIAKEGLLFVDHYGQASCTAGRAAFILGQYPIRSGLSTVGLPGAAEGISTKDPTIANLLKPLGLRDRTIWQEPPWRSRRPFADQSRLRRIFRHPLSPQRW